MVDRNLEDFQDRLGKIDRIHRAGGGFEAEGTLGMSHETARRKRRRLPRWPATLLVLVTVLFALKIGLIATIGEDAYQARLVEMRRGAALDRAGAVLLGTDPLSSAVAKKVRAYMR